jgi:RNA ligase (TIGR02306 family)
MSTFTCPIVTVKTVTPNSNSDNLDILTFEEIGWVCQDVRGKRKVGDKVIYIPIDSLVDCTRPEFAFLMKNAKMRTISLPAESNRYVEAGVVEIQKPMARIKTIKLRGEISQGLVIDLEALAGNKRANNDVNPIPKNEIIYPELQYVPEYVGWMPTLYFDATGNNYLELESGVDVAKILGVIKYEPPQEAVFSANAKSTFPKWCPKTDAERYQNFNRVIEPYFDDLFTVSVKIDGTSLTVFYDSLREGDEFGVCSRNQELKSPEQDLSSSNLTKYGFTTDAYWKAATQYSLLEKARSIAVNNGYQRVALQFELAGEGIQKNRLGLKGQFPYLFDIYVTKEGFEGYLDYTEMLRLADEYNISTVPILERAVSLSKFLGNPPNFSFLHNNVRYPNGHLVEGVVFVSVKEKFVGKLGRLKFKYINPYYLLSTEKGEE